MPKHVSKMTVLSYVLYVHLVGIVNENIGCGLFDQASKDIIYAVW
jgi:hypothetical protein